MSSAWPCIDGDMVFTYHHSRAEGWQSLAHALLDAGFVVVNSHPVKAEMSVATPKSQAREPIQLDIIIVCRKHGTSGLCRRVSTPEAIESAKSKLGRLRLEGFTLSRNDRKIVLFGQLLTTLNTATDTELFAQIVEAEIDATATEDTVPPRRGQQSLLFEDA